MFKFKFLCLLLSFLFLVTTFQNCVVQEDENGNVSIQEELPHQFDKLKVNSEISGQVENSFEVDLNLQQMSLEASFYNPSSKAMESCQESAVIDEALKAELLAKYQKSSLCREYVSVEPDTVCTMAIRPDTIFKVYQGESVILNEKLGRSPCREGAVNYLCDDNSSESLSRLLENLKQSLLQRCI